MQDSSMQDSVSQSHRNPHSNKRVLPSKLGKIWEETGRSPFAWLVFSALCGFLDYWSGPILHFQIAYALPIALAAWHRGLRWAIPMAMLLSCLRLAFLHHEEIVFQWGVTGANLIIRMVVLNSLAILVHRTARLSAQVTQLEGLLSICAWCKNIRSDDGQWVPFETYLAQKPKVDLTHGICPDCSQQFFHEAVTTNRS